MSIDRSSTMALAPEALVSEMKQPLTIDAAILATVLNSSYRTKAQNDLILSDPSYLDWKLSHHFTPPTTMAEHRMTHKKPELFDLIHHWNLTADQKESMDYYQLRTISAGSLGYLLDKDLGKLFDNSSGRTFVPIYQHTSKQQIKIDRSMKPHWTYFLSFRAIGTTNIVLIQRSRSDS